MILNTHRAGRKAEIVKVNHLPENISSSAMWTMADWAELADENIREFDAIDLLEKAKRESARHTNLQNSQYAVSLHHDSKGLPCGYIRASIIKERRQ